MMATDVILPALGMSQDTGKIVQWLKSEGEHVVKGEPLVEIETDKATVEIEASADGVLARVSASNGDDVPVGQVIALILSANEVLPEDGVLREEQQGSQTASSATVNKPDAVNSSTHVHSMPSLETTPRPVTVASTLASRIAAEHNVDLSQVKSSGKRIQKADVLAYLQNQASTPATASTFRLVMASPKARRLAAEQGKDLTGIQGSGPDGAVLSVDVLEASTQTSLPKETSAYIPQVEEPATMTNGYKEPALSNTWRIMAERTTQSWTDVPHFYLTREVNASRFINWRENIMKRSTTKVTYTDLLVKVVAVALRSNPRMNASWSAGKITLHSEVHMGLAVAVEDGLVVPVIHQADTLSPGEIAQKRAELVTKAQTGKLRPQDISGGTFTISNLGMYNVDAFNAIINQPQAAILAVGRIAERVVPVHGQPAVQPMMVLTLSCDHRAVDGARGASFLESVANLIEEPLGLLS
jgi:pyruvate dehydrogenase E2 component (dihydrolipoamide acetyltransferase)